MLIFIYSGLSMGVAREKYLRLQLMNLAPCLLSDILMLRRIIVSRIDGEV